MGYESLAAANDEIEISRNRASDADRQAALGRNSDAIAEADAEGESTTPTPLTSTLAIRATSTLNQDCVHQDLTSLTGPMYLDGVEHAVQSLVRPSRTVDSQGEQFLSVTVEDFHPVLSNLHRTDLCPKQPALPRAARDSEFVGGQADGPAGTPESDEAPEGIAEAHQNQDDAGDQQWFTEAECRPGDDFERPDRGTQ